MTTPPHIDSQYNPIIANASAAYRRYCEWRKRQDGDAHGPRPTGSDVVRLALGMPDEYQHGTPWQEHMWAVLVDKAIDLADDREVR